MTKTLYGFKQGEHVILNSDMNYVYKAGTVGTFNIFTRCNGAEAFRVIVEGKGGIYPDIKKVSSYAPKKCSKCHSILPEKTELQKKLDVIDGAIAIIRSDKEMFSCHALMSKSNGDSKIKYEYLEFLEPYMIGVMYGERLNPLFETIGIRIVLLREFKKVLEKKYDK